MKAFILLQDKWCEGNFGDTELSQTIIHGVFSTGEKATEKMASLPKEIFYESGLSGGEREEPYYIEEYEIDKI